MNIPFHIDHMVLLQVAITGFCIIIALNLYQRREVSGTRYLAFLMAALGIWTLAAGLETAVLSKAFKISFSKIMYLGIQSVSPLLFSFSAEYSGHHKWLTPKKQLFLWMIPVITLLLVATNEAHWLVWSKIEPSPVPGSTNLVYEHGIWFWISSIYHYFLIFIASILLIIGAKENKHKRQFWQISLILVGLAIAWGTNIAYVLGITPIPGLDITPISFTVTIALVSLAIYPMRFLDIAPVARSKLVDTMRDAFFVVNENKRLIDVNPAGEELLQKNIEQILGKPVNQVFECCPELASRFQDLPQIEEEVFVIGDSETGFYDVRITPLSKSASSTGWLVILRDITQNKMTEKELEHQATGLRLVSEISLSIAATKNSQSLLQDVVDLTTQRFGLYFVQIYLLDPVRQTLQLAAGTGKPGQILRNSKYHIPLRNEQSIVAWAAITRQAFIVNDVLQDEKYLPNPNLPNTRSEMAIPILFRDDLLGVLDIQSNEKNHFSEVDRHIQNTLAAQISVAWMNARLFDDLHTRAREAETLRQASSVVASTLNQDKAIELILEQLKQVVPYDSSSVQLLRGDYLEIVGGIGFPEMNSILGLRFPLGGISASASVFHNKSPLIIEDVHKDFPDFQADLHHQIHGWMGIPLLVQNEIIGVITLDSFTPAAFSQTHARLAQAFADHVAIALENARLFEDTRRLATIDPLTNIFNRRHFYELAHIEFERSCRYHRPLSAIMFDLDHFKQVNDTYGHSTGDRVLQVIAETCRTRLRKSDIFGRYGGEEFVIIMPETDKQRAWNIAERLRRSIARTSIPVNDNSLTITISLGVATLSHEALFADLPGDILEKLIDYADQALYKAKQAGRNRIIVHTFEDLKL